MKTLLRKIWPLFFFMKGLNTWRLFGYKCAREWGIYFLLDKGYLSKKFVMRPLVPRRQIRAEHRYQFGRSFKISVLLPLCGGTSFVFLEETIRSLLCQSYENWELCLVDAVTDRDGSEKSILEKYAKSNKRIVYKAFSGKSGVSQALNVATEMASGDYYALLPQNDLLHPSALYEIARRIESDSPEFIYTDECSFHTTPFDAFDPLYKPDFSPDNLRACNYIGGLCVFKASLLDEVGYFRSEFDGVHDYDMILRLTEVVSSFSHIPKVLYYRRAIMPQEPSSSNSAGVIPRILTNHIDQIGLRDEIMKTEIPNLYRIKYDISGEPLISILIPNKDYINDLEKCVSSILSLSTYRNFEIIIIENNSELDETFSYYESIGTNEKVRVIKWDGVFNFSAINNFGVTHSHGDYLLFLNNDIEIISPQWLEEMLGFAQRKDVGAVGAMLYYPDETIQHAGVILGLGGVAAHSHKHFERGSPGYMNRLSFAQNLTAVTAACMMMSRAIFDEVGGFDPEYRVAFNDVDLCMRIRRAGYLIVFTPFAEAYHYESKSRGSEDTPEKEERFEGEKLRFQKKWHKELTAGDPYYNPNLTTAREDFSIDVVVKHTKGWRGWEWHPAPWRIAQHYSAEW